MEARTATGRAPAPMVRRLSPGDLFFEHVQEITDLIARRAHELFEASGYTDGHDLEDWLRAESEILNTIPLELRETEDDLNVLADVPGFTENDLEVCVEPRRLFITGKRQEISEQKKGSAIYSERRSNQVFRALDLPVEIDADGVKATLTNGLLEVTLPKAATAKKVTKAASA